MREIDREQVSGSEELKWWQSPIKALILCLANGFGLGLSPIASGTVGTLLGIPLFLLLAPPYGTWFAYAVVTVLFTVLAIVVSTQAEKIYKKKDDGRVVIDEVAGFLFTMFLVPLHWKTLLLGFLLFRLFDILKPAPAYQAQLLGGGLGIVLDDVVAGIYACLALHAFRCVWILSTGSPFV